MGRQRLANQNLIQQQHLLASPGSHALATKLGTQDKVDGMLSVYIKA